MKLRSAIGKTLVSLSILLCVFVVAMAQDQKPTPAPSPTPAPTPAATPAPQATVTPAIQPATPAPPAANPADVKSIDSIIAAVYDVISGPAGKKRDWDRMRSLFIPGARLIPTGARRAGGYGSRVMTVDGYIEGSSPFFEKEGFYETETARVTEQFGQIAHVFSTYDSRHAPADAKPFARGINSIQLMNDGSRWWIVTIFWQGEDEKNPLPEKYLKK